MITKKLEFKNLFKKLHSQDVPRMVLGIFGNVLGTLIDDKFD